MVSVSRTEIKILSAFFAFIFFNCASQLPPGGGDIDKIPPRIIDIYPENFTTNYDEKFFEIEFSEYVEKRSVRDAIFISPALEGIPELDWSGKSVKINFPQQLRENTTYVVTIGTDVVDYNNRNRMAEAFTFTFSTGSRIDKKTINGRIYNEQPDGVMLFVYKISSDTVNPMITKPDFISQTGSDGRFKISGLSEGTYRVFAIRDELRDLLFQPEQDKYASPFTDIILTEKDTAFFNLNLFLTEADTMSPGLFSASMTDRFHILLRLSEDYDSTIITSNNFFIYDSTTGKKQNIKYAFKGNTKNGEMVLVTEEELTDGNNIFIFADTLKDKNGNIFLNDFSSLAVSERPDTSDPGVFKTLPPNGSRDVDFLNPGFQFYFNDAFDSLSAKKGITFKDTLKKSVEYFIKFLDDASFVITPLKRLEAQKDYIIEFDLSQFEDAAGNAADTIYQYKFKTITGLDFTGASGVVSEAEYEKNPVLVLQGIDGSKEKYTQKINSSGKFNFNRVKAGEYTLWCYLDEDSSSSYDYGWVYPFETSEEFSFHPDTLNLRPRWSQTDINFIFKK